MYITEFRIIIINIMHTFICLLYSLIALEWIAPVNYNRPRRT